MSQAYSDHAKEGRMRELFESEWCSDGHVAVWFMGGWFAACKCGGR